MSLIPTTVVAIAVTGLYYPPMISVWRSAAHRRCAYAHSMDTEKPSRS